MSTLHTALRHTWAHPSYKQVEHRQRHEREEARQREQARAKRDASKAEEEAERLAAEAKRQERNRAANTWTLRGHDHSSVAIDSTYELARAEKSRPWAIGTRIEALYQAQSHGRRRCLWFPGTIASEADAEGRCDVQYDDGDFEAHVPSEYLRLLAGTLPLRVTAAGSVRHGDQQPGSGAEGGSEAELEGTAREDAEEKPAVLSGREPRPVRSASARVPRPAQTSDDAGVDAGEGAQGMGTGDTDSRRLVGGEDGGLESDEYDIDWGETSDDGSDEDYQG